MPLRIAVAGQISAGKSSLINALLGRDVAEVDVIPTTDAARTYETTFDDVEAMLLDMPGLDGSAKIGEGNDKMETCASNGPCFHAL